MRDGWQVVPLGEVTHKRTDFEPVEPNAEYVILGVQRSGWGFVEREPIKGRDQKFTKLMRLEEHDLVYRTITAFEAPSAVAGPNEVGRHVTPQTFPVFKIDNARLLPDYMRLLTTWPRFHDEMASRCTGTVLRRKTLAVEAFRSIPVSLPPVTEQRRIVDLIDALDDTIMAADYGADSLSRFTDARLRTWFGPRGESVNFDEVVTFASGVAFPPTAQGDETGTIPFIKVSDMNRPGNETSIMTANNHVTEQVLRQLKAKTWPAGTVIFPKVGAALLTEKRRVLSRDTAFDNNIMGVIARDGVVTPLVLFAFMRTVRLGDYAQIGAMPSVNQKHLKSLSFPVLTHAEQRLLEDEVRALDDAVAESRLVADRLRDLRSNLLTALLSGEHEIPESYDAVMGELAETSV